MKKSFLSLATISVLAVAGSVQFKTLPPQTPPLVREMPHKEGAILSYYDAIKEAKQCVVNISTQKKLKQALIQNPFMNDQFFRQFFGDLSNKMVPKERVERSLGSGVILSSDGFIVTNNHVIANSDQIIVTLPGVKKEYVAKVIGTDPRTDLAVIKIEANGLSPIVIGDSQALKEGDVVFAIGNPFGVGESISHGIISALNKAGLGVNDYENFIQTDAPINPGNSGGALIDSRGLLIGINTMIISSGGGNNGIGFAIPTAMVKRVVSELVEKGRVDRGYMGVSIDSLSKTLQEYYKRDTGAVIVDVGSGTPAEKAGIKRGDLVISFNGKSVEDGRDLRNKIGELNPKDIANLEILRDGKIHTMSVKLAMTQAKEPKVSQTKEQASTDGLTVVTLTKELATQYRLNENTTGALVTKVDEGSDVARVGIFAGDVIIQIESFPITMADDVHKAMKSTKDLKRVYLKRQDRIILVIMK